MKIVISGSNGYAASNIISFFKRIGLDAETYAFDLEGVESYSRFDSADLFIHAGAISTNQTQSERLFELNCFKTAEYLHEWRSRSSKSSVFVFFSSHHVNVGLKTGFRTPYSASKQCAEEFISSIHRLGGNPGRRRSIIIRPGVIWGRETVRKPDQRSMFWRIYHGELSQFFLDSSRYYVHVDDLSKLLLLFWKKKDDIPATPLHVYDVVEPILVNSTLFNGDVDNRIPRKKEAEGLRFPMPHFSNEDLTLSGLFEVTRSCLDYKNVIRDEVPYEI